MEKDEEKRRTLADYKIWNKKLIGKGSYADVKLARDMITKVKVALKIYEKSRLNCAKRRQNVLREIKILK